MPCLSIVVPVYNSSRYINECIFSILSQGFRDFELLLIDDGSQDDSFEKCEEWRQQDNRISLYKQENSGPSAARNLGIRKAIGEYVIFIDSDDVIAPTYLEEMVSQQMKYGRSVLVVSTITLFYDNYEFGDDVVSNSKGNMIKKEDFVKLYKRALFNSPVNKVYSLFAIKKNNIFFPESIQIGEDLLFNIEYLKKSGMKEYYIIEGGKYFYRRSNKESLSTSFKDHYYEHVRMEYDSLCELVELYKVSEEDKKLLAEEFHYLLWMVIINNMRRDNPVVFFKKIQQNQHIIEQEGFKDLVLQDPSMGAYIHKYVRKAAQSGNFCIIWIAEKFARKVIKLHDLFLKKS